MKMSTKLKVASFNFRGFKSAADSISKLFKEVDILAVQEHWLLPTELGNLASINEEALYSAVFPMEMDKIVVGRPFGGVAILWHKRFYQSVSTIQTASDRMSAIWITTDLGTILIISVYMPVDYGNEQSVEDYITEIGLLGGLLESNEYDSVTILGDLNTDLRKGTSHFQDDWLHLCRSAT